MAGIQKKTGGPKLLRAMSETGFNSFDFPPPTPDLSLPTAAPGPLCAQVKHWRQLLAVNAKQMVAAAEEELTVGDCR